MNIKEKLLRLQQQKLYKMTTPKVFKEEFKDKPWFRRKSDATDYFNYGFNEATFQLFAQKLASQTDANITRIQREYTNSHPLWKKIQCDGIPIDYAGTAAPFDHNYIPVESMNVEQVLYSQIDFFDQEPSYGEFLYNCDQLVEIYDKCRDYLMDLNTQFDFDKIFQEKKPAVPNYLLELQQLVDRQRSKSREKKKPKKEKKEKKEKKAKKMKKQKDIVPSPRLSPSPVPVILQAQQIYQEQPQPVKEIMQEQPQVQEVKQPRNWPRSFIQGILQGNNKLRK